MIQFDIDELFKQKGKSQIKILELGSYLSVFSIALSKMGYKMTASDLDIFMQNKNLQNKYELNNISFKSIDLKNRMPFLDQFLVNRWEKNFSNISWCQLN
jgi:hypothetical protein